MDENDDHFPVDPCSLDGYDTLLQVGFTKPGVYYLAVGKYDELSPVPAGGTYTLQVSIEGHPVQIRD